MQTVHCVTPANVLSGGLSGPEECLRVGTNVLMSSTESATLNFIQPYDSCLISFVNTGATP